jgi:hypothetical protein
MDVRVFYEVVCPLLEMDVTSLICISTILNKLNFFSKLVNLVDGDGKQVFLVLKFTLECDFPECKADPTRCFHKIHEIPRWQSRRKHKRIRLIMQDQYELLLRETM